MVPAPNLVLLWEAAEEPSDFKQRCTACPLWQLRYFESTKLLMNNHT